MIHFLIILVSILTYNTSYARHLSVITSIKPLHSLVLLISKDLNTIEHITEETHNHYLSFQDKKKISDADIFFFFNQDLESFVSRKYEKNAFKLIENDIDIPLLFYRDKNIFSNNSYSTHYNFHIWLSPKSIIPILNKITSVLSMSDPDNSDVYQNNLDEAISNLKEISSSIHSLLAPLVKPQFIVIHDGYQYFEQEFNIFASATVISSPSHLPPGPKTISNILNLMDSKNIRTVISDPIHKNYSNFFKEKGFRVCELDPELSQNHSLNYYDNIRYFAERLNACLNL